MPACLALLALFAAAPHAAHAQTLHGRAVDRVTQQLVADAEITLVDAQGEAAATVRSGVDGTFRVSAAVAGDYRVAARKAGYQTMLSSVVQLAEGQLLQVEARLTPQQGEQAALAEGTRRGISGRVVEIGTRRPIPRATVALLNDRGQHVDRVTADAEGSFHVSVPSPDRYQLRT